MVSNITLPPSTVKGLLGFKQFKNFVFSRFKFRLWYSDVSNLASYTFYSIHPIYYSLLPHMPKSVFWQALPKVSSLWTLAEEFDWEVSDFEAQSTDESWLTNQNDALKFGT